MAESRPLDAPGLAGASAHSGVPGGPAARRRRVLIVHTGGTLGMRPGPNGYEPAPGHLASLLAAMPELAHPALPEVELVETDPLLDSSNMRPSDWLLVARTLVARCGPADGFDGFVVIHGTDTLAYTASALSFLLEGLGRPVVVTGSQIPLVEPRTDARQNLLGALLVAAGGGVPEVSVCFHGRVMRGSRVTKVDAEGLDAFDSPNLPPLARLGVGIDVDERLRLPAGTGLRPLPAALDAVVGIVRLFPGMSAQVLENLLRPPLQGLVLETYGAGNAPDRDPALLAALRAAGDVVVVATTQCLRGGVHLGTYATGSALARCGVIGVHDMTPEAAVAKLVWLLSSGATPEDTRRLMPANLVGELTARP